MKILRTVQVKADAIDAQKATVAEGTILFVVEHGPLRQDGRRFLIARINDGGDKLSLMQETCILDIHVEDYKEENGD